MNFESGRFVPGPLSQAAWEEAESMFPGGVNSPVRSFSAVGGQPPVFTRAKGGWIFDADKRAYLDFCQSWGALILGHSTPRVVAAVKRQASRATSFGAPSTGENELARLVLSAMPGMERVRFVSSGTEAVMSALRLARAYTGRPMILKFDGCYHGHSDGLLVHAGSGLATLSQSASDGVPRDFAVLTISVPYNNLEAVIHAFDKYADKIAAVIVEPVAANMGLVLPKPGFLEGLRTITRERGALLVFDEVITGFRLGLNGAQGYYGISPDLTTLGKIVGGGLPAAAYGGRAEIMKLISPTGPVYQAGTLSGNPLAMAAGSAQLKALFEPGFYDRLAETTANFADSLRAVIDPSRFRIASIASMFTLFCTPGLPVDFESAKQSDTALFARVFHRLLARGVYFSPAQFEACFVGAAHRSKDLARVRDAVAAATDVSATGTDSTAVDR